MNPRLEVINTGTELLLGSVVNTHLKFLAEALFPLGLRISRQVTVPDGREIRDSLADTFGRAQIVLLTGGLGPTTDDLTREIVAEMLNLSLIHDESVMTAITQRFARRGLTLTERVSLQALRPPEATVLTNHNGTAPGLYLPPLETGKIGGISPHLFLLPGPPKELKPMFENSVIPMLKALIPEGSSELKRTFRVTGRTESYVEAKVGPDLLKLGIELGYCARPGEVDIRVIGPGELLERAELIILEKLGDQIFSLDNRSLEQVVVELLTARQETLSTAESCTGGHLADSVTNVPGASRIFMAGFVTYANEAKAEQLGVDLELIREHGAVSEFVAAEMAKGALRVSGTDYALATTGIAGPEGGTPAKPVGTVYIALACKRGPVRVHHHTFATDRETFKSLAVQAALDLLRRYIAS